MTRSVLSVTEVVIEPNESRGFTAFLRQDNAQYVVLTENEQARHAALSAAGLLREMARRFDVLADTPDPSDEQYINIANKTKSKTWFDRCEKKGKKQ